MDIRKTYLDYFKKYDHMIMPSASLIPSDDPSVLLTTAGMQQFKPYYLGIKKPPHKKITTVQKCFRTSDIDSVGYTDRHLTFFEMLGNFAFADYFKKEAINYALDFIIDVLKLPISNLSVGVFAGDKSIPEDKEAIELWKSRGITEEKIYKYGKSENFWGPAGDTGPCGPCTEIYYDFGQEYGCGTTGCSPSCDCGRFLEIWNLVFTQYNYNGNDYEELPNKNIDTGMGLERIEAVLEGDPSVFRTKLFRPIVNKVEELSGKQLLSKKDKEYSSEANRCIKIVADHSRAVSFLIADGVTPSNESRGYILRRILRRAIRFGKLINIKDFFLSDIVEVIIDSYSRNYHELKDKRDMILRVIKDEEKRFSQTLKEGTKVLNQKVDELRASGKKYLDPEVAFKLYDTFGFPVELTIEILNEGNLELDINSFNHYLKMHSEKSKIKAVFDKKIETNLDVYKQVAYLADTEFMGYYELKTSSKIISILKEGEDGRLEIADCLNAGQKGEIILDRTPFYGEKGGQAGDKGLIKTETGIFTVNDTKIPVEGVTIHSGTMANGTLSNGQNTDSEVDIAYRETISKNHTSTHILHWALRTLFGKDVSQAGSFIGNDRFRFDYNINLTPSGEEIEKIERLINEKIQKDDTVKIFETTREYAEEIGAISLFEEKYGKFVRVVEIDDYSRELCGGIHVNRTGEIGLLKIMSDSGIGSNVRRIEAITGLAAFNHLSSSYKILADIASDLDTESANARAKIDLLKQDFKKISDELLNLQISAIKKEILEKNEKNLTEEGMKIISFNFSLSEINPDIDVKNMGIIGDEIRNGLGNKNLFLLFANIFNGKPVIIFQASKDLVEKGLDCSQIAREAGKLLKGGGGGKPEFAQVGGPDNRALNDAIELSRNLALEKIRQTGIKGSG